VNPPLPRSEFAVTERLIYLNHAAVGVLPQSSVAAIDELLRAHAEAGVLGTWPFDERTDEYRETIARFIGATKAEIAFVASTSAGAAVLAQSIAWNDGDEIVLANDEFPSNVVPWLAVRERGVRVRLIDSASGPLTPDRLRREIGPKTRVVAVSWVSYADGYRRDLASLAEVAHDAGALLCVDAIQGLGALPVDVRACGADALFSGAGKWLLGLHGAGFLFVRDGVLERLRPGVPGWRAQSDIWDFHNYDQAFSDDARRLETGTPNLAGNLALHNSVELLRRSDTAAIERWVLDLTDRLCDGLTRLGARLLTQRSNGVKSGIVAFEMPGVDSRWLGGALSREGVVTTYRDAGIRVSPHGYNLPDEIDAALETIAALTTSAAAR
jgi:cysteine desulfurase / selenocysteine lyase